MKSFKVYILKIFEITKWYLDTRKFEKLNKKTDKNVMFVELCSSLLTIKINCLFSLAFKKKFNIYVLFPHKSKFYEFFYRIIGVKNFIYLDGKIDLKKKCNFLFKKNYNTSSFLNFKYESISVGKYVASKYLMINKLGKFQINNSNKKKIFDMFYESISSIEISKKKLLKYNIDVMIFNERGYSPAGEIFDFALKNKIKCIQWFGAPIADNHSFKSYTWKNRTKHPLTLCKSSQNYLKKKNKRNQITDALMMHLRDQYYSGKWFNRQKLQTNKKIFSKKELLTNLKIHNTNKLCVIFTHVFNDATFFYGRSLFSSYEDWLREILLFIKDKKKTNWIIKIHPANLLRSKISLEEKLIEKVFRKLPDHIRIIKPNSIINTYSFFGNIDVALTVRGTIGCELACYGVPVITAGTGRYSNEGFTVDPKNKKEFFNFLININNIRKLNSKEIKLARIYTYGSLIARSIKMDGIYIDYNTKKISLEKSTLRFIPKDYDDLMTKSDIKKFVNWVQSDLKQDLMEIDYN